jgi:hypothetical protein
MSTIHSNDKTPHAHSVLVSGTLLLAFKGACVNLNFLIEDEVQAYLASVQPIEWHPLERYEHMLSVVTNKYVDPAPILEQIGIEIINVYYHRGPGKNDFQRGVDFLRFQKSSRGYYSLVRGTPEQIGDFSLVELDEAAGKAIVKSTTPFNKDLERGVLLGGLAVTQELLYIDVDNSQDQHIYMIEFH